MNFGFPSQLPTPPETDADVLVGARHPVDLMNAPGSHMSDQETNPQPSVSVPVRRVSTLAYHNSPLRDPRERFNGRQSRWLIVVIPPASLVQDHGPLGHTLTSGPTQRLSQGILMPLQATMYGQLTAIAREFNFPSPVGLCLYLHVTEQGISIAPRISDDIWPSLWGHLFESRSPGPSFQMPICGRVEFDIDRRRALWLNSWLTSDRRHAVDVQVSVPPSLSHHREDSKTSFFDDRGDERSGDLSTMHTTSRSRHIPKKLSLVDRLETPLPFTSSLANAIAGSDTADVLSNTLATVLDEETKPAKFALEKRVESWRASSSVVPTPIASQVHLDPNNTPNNLQFSDVDILADTEEEINLNDFAWSATSLGPLDYDSLPSADSESHVPSVHIDRRLEGSVLLTPSTGTSWGPESLDSPPMSIISRLPSPDIAQRVIEDCPPTPSTATSWGPEEQLYSPASVTFRLPSPDLGQRMLEDCPPTPSTATSWGPEELLYSPASVEFRLPSPDLGHRMLENCPPTPITGTSWRPEHSRSAVSTVSRYPPTPDMIVLSIWPYTPSITTRASRTVEPDPCGHVYPYILTTSRRTWTFVWPLLNAENGSNPLPLQFPDRRRTWTFVWPLYKAENVSNPLPLQIPNHRRTWTFIWPLYKAANGFNPLPLQFPNHRRTWTFVWPLYKAEDVPNPVPLQFPNHRRTWTFIWPLYEAENASTPPPFQFPDQSLAHAAYDVTRRHFRIFPERISATEGSLAPVWFGPLASSWRTSSSLNTSVFASLDEHVGQICGASSDLKAISASYERTSVAYSLVFPYFCVHLPPPAGLDIKEKVESANMYNSKCHLELGTRRLSLDSTEYPIHLMYIYPPAVQSRPATLPSVHLPPTYPSIELYPPQYPFITPYRHKAVPSVNEMDRTPGSAMASPSRQAQLGLLSGHASLYPTFDIYPAVTGHSEAGISLHVPQVYPRIVLYPAVYPELDLYPPVSAIAGHTVAGTGLHVPQVYPRIILYPAVYPELDLYPPVSAVAGHSEAGIDLHVPQVYPRIILYPAVYPELDLYPPVSVETYGIPKTVYPGHVSAGQNDVATSRIAPSLQPVYPQFDIYPAVYPCFDIYRADFLKMEDRRVSLSVMLPAQYPALNLYPVIYPHFEIYPPVVQAHDILVSNHPTLVNAHSPTVGEAGASSPTPLLRSAIKTHRELHEEVFTPVRVFLEQSSSKPSGEIKARRPINSRTTNARPALPQAASAIPPVPPLPISKRSSPRMLSHNAEARHSGPSPPSSQPTDHRTSSHARSDSNTSLNSISRRDHGHSKQGLRPRDSLVLEKARHFDHLHSLSNNGRPSSVVDPAHFSVPPVPQR